jgi:TonB family protein
MAVLYRGQTGTLPGTSAYAEELREDIRRILARRNVPPPSTGKAALVSVRMDPLGEVEHVRLVRSSGDASFDDRVLLVVMWSASARAPSPALRKEMLARDVQFVHLEFPVALSVTAE